MELQRADIWRFSTLLEQIKSWPNRVLVALVVGLLLAACRTSGPAEPPVARMAGKTMGTTYSVIVPGLAADSTLQQAIDSLLLSLNAEVSTYEPESLISKFNRGDTVDLPVLTDVASVQRLQTQVGAHFSANLYLARQPHADTDGYFDPTVGPLVEYYGFGAKKLDASPINPQEVTRLLALVGMEKVVMDTLADASGLRLYASEAGVRLDLSAIAKGYAVDQVLYLLRERFGADNIFVEIGGETRATGLSPRGDAWSVGINTPDPEASLADMALVINLENMAIATSGNYRNTRQKGGKLIVHTIDPHTGEPKSSTLLSASILAPDCATADAYATACMASGEKAVEVLAKAGLPACLIFSTPSGDYEIKYVGEFTRYVQHMPDR